MRAIKLNGTVSKNHELHLRLPSDAPPGPAEVIVFVAEQVPQDTPDSIAQFLQDCQKWPTSGRTKEEIDRYIEEERNSWERGLGDDLP